MAKETPNAILYCQQATCDVPRKHLECAAGVRNWKARRRLGCQSRYGFGTNVESPFGGCLISKHRILNAEFFLTHRHIGHIVFGLCDLCAYVLKLNSVVFFKK